MKEPKDKFAWTVTVGERGQIVIPKQARELFEIEAGDSLLLLADKKRGLAIPPQKTINSLYANLLNKLESEAEEED